jgi:hypothetical protein
MQANYPASHARLRGQNASMHVSGGWIRGHTAHGLGHGLSWQGVPCNILWACMRVFQSVWPYQSSWHPCPVVLQVLTKAVKPPTPDAAKLAAVVSQQQLAMQHVRMQLARMVKQAHPAQVRLYASPWLLWGG